jgi:hypothetical protein
MPHMPRPNSRVAFTAASFISLAVCVATLALWFHSTQRLDRLRSGSPTRRITLHSKDGQIFVELARASAPVWRPGYQHIHALPTQYRPPNSSWEFAGLGGGSDTVRSADGVVHRRFVKIPLWPLAVLSAILPVMWFDRRGRRSSEPEPAAPTSGRTVRAG